MYHQIGKKPNPMETKSYSLLTVLKMLEASQAVTIAAIRSQYELVPKKDAKLLSSEEKTAIVANIMKSNAPAANDDTFKHKEGIIVRDNPFYKFVNHSRSKFSLTKRPSFLPTFVCKENVELAIDILREKQTTCTIREIVAVIAQHVKPVNRLEDYRSEVRRKYVSSTKRLLGRHKGFLMSGKYVFAI